MKAEALSRKVKLSFDKLANLFKRHKYILSSVYCEGSNIRFVECRTPKQQKTFMVFLPDRYEMKIPSDGSFKRLDISSSEAPPSSRQIEFISNMKGPLLECDLLSISSEMLCVYQDNNAKCFYIDAEPGKSESEGDSDDSEDEDEVTSLEKDALKVLKKVDGPNAKLRKASLKERKRPEAEGTETEEAEGEGAEGDEEAEGAETEDTEVEIEEAEGTELVFEDEDGEPYDEVKKTLAGIQAKIDKRDAETFGDSDGEVLEEEDFEDSEEEFHTRDNSLPSELEEGDFVLGIVYVLIDIGSFFKRISEYEDEVVKCYDQLDENEFEMRTKRYDKIKEVTQKFLETSSERMEKISNEEKELKVQLIRLTVVLIQADALRSRVNDKPDKYGEIVEESDRIYDQTRKAIHDLNLELLRLRNEADDLLSNYKSSLEELSDM